MIPNNPIWDSDLKEIEKIAMEYLRSTGRIPDGGRLILTATYEPEFQVSVVRGIPLSLLKENPLALWVRDRGGLHWYGVKIGNLLNNARIQTMYELVTRQQSDILKYRDTGKKCLWGLEDWLKTYGLQFGMIFSEEIAKEFPSVRKTL